MAPKRLTVFCIFLIFFLTSYAQTTISSFSPSSGPVGTLVTINGTGLSNISHFDIANKNALIISNTGTKIVGLVMPGATVGPIYVVGSGSYTTANNFTVTNSSSSYIQQGNKLVGTGYSGNGYIGSSVALSADGNTAIVGGKEDNSSQGAAWIFTRTNGIWSQQGPKLLGAGTVGVSGQGISVSINADGNTAAIGGYTDNNGVGAVWIFTRTNGIWSQQGSKLIGTGNQGNSFWGRSVSLSADGNTLLAGGSYDAGQVGAAWVFTRINNTWSQQGNKLVGTGNTGFPPYEGSSVSLSADGKTAVIGGPVDDANKGAVWVFTKTNNVWTQTGSKLVPFDILSANGTASFGISVAINADGTCIVAGGNNDNSVAGSGPSDNQVVGAAWVFNLENNIWIQKAKLVGSDHTKMSLQGSAVGINATGDVVLLSGPSDNNNEGGVWFFYLNNNSWTQQGTKILGSGNIGNAEQGFSVSMSNDGSTFISGGIADNSKIGAAWVFGSPSNTLPLNLLSFAAMLNDYRVDLEWQTAKEFNLKSFTVQRSTDGYSFFPIYTYKALGNYANNTYNYKDEEVSSLKSNKVFYRLQLNDLDNSYTYSKIVTVIVPLVEVFNLSPNPAKTYFTAKGEDIQKVQVMNISGQIILERQLRNLEDKIYISGLGRGVFIIKGVAKNGKVYTRRLIIE